MTLRQAQGHRPPAANHNNFARSSASAFELAVAAATARSNIAHLREYIGDSVDPAEAALDTAAFDRIDDFLCAAIDLLQARFENPLTPAPPHA